MTADLAVIPLETALLRVSEADMAWMAGVIDVKGTVARKSNKARATPQVVVTVRAKDPRIARRLSALTGTAPETRPSPKLGEFLRRGCTEHCEAPHVHVGEYPWQMPQMTNWSVTGIAAAVVLSNLAPYMVTYDDYAPDVSKIIGTFAAAGQGSGAVTRALARLSRLGWRLPAAGTTRLIASTGEEAP